MPNPPLPPTAARPPSARQRILDAACRLFYRDGVRATGIDRIIAESGVAKMSFYRNFPSKADLVAAYLAARHDRWMAWFTSAVEERLSRPGSGFAVIADILAEWFAAPDFHGCAFINTVAENGTADGEDVHIARRHKADLRDYLASVAARSGSADPAAAAEAMMIVIEGTIVRRQMRAGDGLTVAARALLASIG